MRILRDEIGTRPLFGAFVSSNSAYAAEAMGRSGFDWLAVDLQHAPSSGTDRLATLIAAASAAGAPSLVRIPWKTDFATAMAALDAGAQGVIVPMLDSAGEAAAIAAACHYPPAGSRSFGPWRLAMQHPDYTAELGDRIAMCFVQIETTAGIDNLDAILDVPGVDGAYIGPQDLSLSHGGGLSWRIDNRVLHELCERVFKACRRAGKVAIAHTADPGDALHWAELGFDMVTATNDMRLLAVGAAQALDVLRAASGSR